MDPMEIMMEMTGFRRLGLKAKRERSLYSLPTRMQCLSLSLTRSSSQFARLDTTRVLDVLHFTRRFASLRHENNSYRPIAAYLSNLD
jgi:hypothetical protein